MKTCNFFCILLVFLLAACGSSRANKTVLPPLPIASTAASKTPTHIVSTPSPQIAESLQPSTFRTLNPSDTPNSVPTAIRAPTQVPVSTAVISETGAIPDSVRLGKRYWWRYRVGYMSHELNDFFTVQSLLSNQEEVPQPNAVDGWLFASQRDEIAFLFRNVEGSLELWTSDMNLNYSQKLWVDEENWLGPENTGWRISSFKWGPGENSMLIKRLDNQMVVYSYSEQQAFLFPDSCNWLTQSPFSGKWGQVCKAGDQLLILEVDGKLRPLSIKETAPLIETIAQSIFYDGTRAVFVDPNYQFIEVDASGEKRKLPVYWSEGVIAPIFSDTTWLTPIQWTNSGKSILVFAHPPQQEDCPYTRNQEGEPSLDPCWLLLENDKIVWRLQREKLEELGLNWDNLYTYFDAAISPLDDAVILAISDMPVDFVLLSYFEDKSVEVISNGEYHKIVWKLMSR